ncbi:PKD domain-containing protein [Sphingobacterium sp. R2]|uniref:PKD domain-containing protein n=1 Tax=Sphingobacterium sp. R2 TaxID=3112958 RepID=UPI00345DC0B6
MDRNFIEEGDERNVSKSNPRIYLFIIIFLVVALLAGLIYFFKAYTRSEEKISAKINKTEIYLNEDLIYADNTNGAKKWVWEFGNGDKSTKQQGTYRFNKVGSYVVRLTVNENLREQFFVSVKDSVVHSIAQDTTLFISGSTNGIVLEEIRLEANGPGEIFEWWFGETGKVDAIGKSALYTYTKPGVYQVRLRSDKSSKFATHNIRIVDPAADINQLVTPGKGAQDALNDLKEKIQDIANGADFNSKYSYILSKYLCGDEKVKVNVEMDGQKKQMDIYAYLMGLTFSKGVTINEVTVESASTPNATKECPTLIKVKQSK